MLDQPQLPVAQRTNPERSFREEVRALQLGNGEVFRGEGILAVTKAILQSGVAYVGGETEYQKYHQLAVQRRIAREQYEAAQMNQFMATRWYGAYPYPYYGRW